MTVTANKFPFPAGVHPEAVLITAQGQAALEFALSNPARWEWDVIALDFAGEVGGPVLAGAEVVDSFEDLTGACEMAIALNRIDREKKTRYLVQRHVG